MQSIPLPFVALALAAAPFAQGPAAPPPPTQPFYQAPGFIVLPEWHACGPHAGWFHIEGPYDDTTNTPNTSYHGSIDVIEWWQLDPATNQWEPSPASGSYDIRTLVSASWGSEFTSSDDHRFYTVFDGLSFLHEHHHELKSVLNLPAPPNTTSVGTRDEKWFERYQGFHVQPVPSEKHGYEKRNVVTESTWGGERDETTDTKRWTGPTGDRWTSLESVRDKKVKLGGVGHPGPLNVLYEKTKVDRSFWSYDGHLRHVKRSGYELERDYDVDENNLLTLKKRRDRSFLGEDWLDAGGVASSSAFREQEGQTIREWIPNTIQTFISAETYAYGESIQGCERNFERVTFHHGSTDKGTVYPSHFAASYDEGGSTLESLMLFWDDDGKLFNAVGTPSLPAVGSSGAGAQAAGAYAAARQREDELKQASGFPVPLAGEMGDTHPFLPGIEAPQGP